MAGSKVSVVGRTTRRIEYKESNTLGILLAGSGNDYYQRVMYTIASSGTTLSAVNLLRDYISGLGFRDRVLSKLTLNRYNQSANTLLSLLAQDYSRGGFGAVAVVYNGLLEPVEYLYVPAEFVRFKLPDDNGKIPGYVIYSDWDKQKNRQYDEKKFQSLSPYNPDPIVISKQIEEAGSLGKWGGQLFIISDQNSEEYPLATIDSVFVNVETDGLIQVFKHRTTTKGFMPNGIFHKPGIFASDKERETFLEEIEDYQGAENSSAIIVVEFDTPELVPNFTPMTFPNVDKVFELTEKTVKENIIQLFKIPPILLSVKTPGELGGSNEWDNAKLYYDETTSRSRSLFSTQFGILLKHFAPAKTITDTTIISLGEGVKASGNSIFKSLGKDAMTGIQSILDSAYSDEVKVNLIVEGYGIDEVRARKFITAKTEPQV